MNTNTIGFIWISKIFESLALGEGSLSIGRANRECMDFGSEDFDFV